MSCRLFRVTASLRHEKARHLVVGRVCVRPQIIGYKDLPHRQESGLRCEFFEERALPGREVHALSTKRNFGAAIDEHRSVVHAPRRKNVSVSKTRPGPRFSSANWIEKIFPFSAPCQHKSPVRGEPPGARAFSRRVATGQRAPDIACELTSRQPNPAKLPAKMLN